MAADIFEYYFIKRGRQCLVVLVYGTASISMNTINILYPLEENYDIRANITGCHFP